MSTKLGLILIAAIFGAGVGLGYWIGTGQEPDIVTKTKTKYIDREVPVDDGERSNPTTEYIYKTITDTVKTLRVDTVYVPKAMSDYVVSNRRPLDVSSSSVRFRFYDPTEGRYQIDEYAIPDKIWDYGLWAEGLREFTRKQYYVGLGAELGYKNVYVTGRGYHNINTSENLLMAGVKINIIDR